MSAVIETKPEIFSPVTYYDKRTINSTSPRWVGFPGDLIVAERKAEISWLKAGGEETPCPCLQRYGRGFVPRGRAALLELGGEPIPMRHLGELQSSAWQGIELAEEAVKNKFGFIPVFPGDGLKVLKRYAMNPLRKGMDELTTLAGKSWDECHDAAGTGILDVIEAAMFGDGMEPTLRGLEEQIKSAKVVDNRIDVGKYKEEWLTLCADFRTWGERMVSVDTGLLALGSIPVSKANLPEGSIGGWSYAYSPLGVMLIEQLELKRQDQPIQEMSQMVSQILASQQTAQPAAGLSASDMELFERKMEERLVKARAAWEAERIAAEELTCEGCGQVCGSKAGKLAHQRFCKALENA